MENQNAEIKAKIKNHFVEINEDKFTKVRVVKCKQEIEWSNTNTMRNRFMMTENAYSHSLKLKIDYRHTENTDSVFFVFTYANTDDGYPHMHNLKLFLIIDGDKTIELSDVSGQDTASKSSRVGDRYINIYLETAQLQISTADFIQIANANKLEYSIRFGAGKLDGSFTESELNIFKGFYNSTFDEDFEVEKISSYINSNAAKPKANNSNSSGGGCYIATMAYGSYEHPQVMVLRDFRDNYLSKRTWGSKFITTYYKYSPKLVKHLKNKVLINRLVRGILNLFIKTIK